ncbi:MAG: TRCF domain-containing protein, partial [Cyclobacteriaceae bacterium]
ETSFFFEDTPDQAKAVTDVKEDMMMPHPMDRLVCGDVGFGKTEVAIRAAFKAAINGRQTAVLVPTTILAMQHNNTFRERLANFPVRVEYINRFRSSKEVKQTLGDLATGKVDIIIGTHRLVNRDVKFKNLGLLVIDEEQKFGVSVKEKLKELKVNVDTLTLTATPIPRTLHFSLMGARDLSIISTPPPNRQPVTTEIHHFNDRTIRDAISYELRRGGQVFFVHNRIANIDEVANIIYQLVPDARIGIAHGQMEGKNLEKVMLRFIGGEYDVLVSTNIIESGLDIPNANTIIINHAHMFGLSDLHQMRGRVGRSNKKAFCYLLSPPTIKLSSDARKRLSTLEEFSDLGAGLKVAMRDLDIRGAGNLLGREQSGFITDLGFEMYHKILDEAVKELKESEFKDLFTQELSETIKPLVQDCTIETDLELLIPEAFVANISERLSLYSQLDNIEEAEQLQAFTTNLKDRFGPLPDSVKDLIETVKLRWQAQALGLEKLTLKSNTMKGYFLSPEQAEYYHSDVFGYILQCVKQQPARFRLKEVKNRLILTVNEVIGVKQAISILSKLEIPANSSLKKVQNT